MGKCRHDTALFYRWLRGVWVAFAAAPRAVAFDCARMTCVSCGEWLSLGPSDDESPEVQVEIRAAEIAAGNNRHALSTRFDFHGTEWEGWRGREINPRMRY